MEPINTEDDHESRKSILKILIGLAKSDGVIQDKELLFVLDAAKSFGFSEASVRDWIKEDAETETKPATEQERMTVIYYMLFLCRQDSILHKAEENYIYHFGFKLGFNESMLRDMVQLFKEKHTTEITPDDLLSIIKKYLN